MRRIEQHHAGAVDWRLTLPQRLLADETAGHADDTETSMTMYYDPGAVDLGTLPPREVPLHSCEFSIVDGAAFTPRYPRDHVVRNDPRDAARPRTASGFSTNCGRGNLAETDQRQIAGLRISTERISL